MHPNFFSKERFACIKSEEDYECEVKVFLGYTVWNRRTLIDKRLYLPDDWANDPVRRFSEKQFIGLVLGV